MSMKIAVAHAIRNFTFTTELKLEELRLEIDITLKLVNKHLVSATERADWLILIWLLDSHGQVLFINRIFIIYYKIITIYAKEIVFHVFFVVTGGFKLIN